MTIQITDANGDLQEILSFLNEEGVEVPSNVTMPFAWAVSMGMVSGFSHVDKFGELPEIDVLTAPMDIWENGGEYTYDSSAAIVSVSSSSTSDTGKTLNVQGLDIDGTFISQDVALSGQSTVALATPLWRVFRMSNATDTLDTTFVGTIYCYVGTTQTAGVPTTANIRAVVTAGSNQTLMSLFTVQKEKVAFLVRMEFGSRRSKDGDAECCYFLRKYGKGFKIKKRVDVVNNGTSSYQDKRSFPDAIPALSDIRMRVEAVSKDDMGIYSTFDLLLVDEDQFSDAFLQSIGQPGY